MCATLPEVAPQLFTQRKVDPDMTKYMAKKTAVVKLATGHRRAIRVGRLYDDAKDPTIKEVVAQYPKFFDALEPVVRTETADSEVRSTEIPWPEDEED